MKMKKFNSLRSISPMRRAVSKELTERSLFSSHRRTKVRVDSLYVIRSSTSVINCPSG